ncbi:MAG TPA: alpha-isopropylmalate synthase regulatory domain-containing protein, partial [Bryobacteraceae bacterium]|nr:alpha-isopropylmalate synthase regulatory domain-containing protein [Bryobacteraceae bacterium]
MSIFLLDNTLGRHPGRAVLSFTLEEMWAIAARLDGAGIDYIEAGCSPGDRRSAEFFARAPAECALAHARLVACARLETVHDAVDRDAALGALLDASTPVVALAARAWDAAPGDLSAFCRNLAEAVRHLKSHAREVIFRAEDFFDDYAVDAAAAMQMLEAAKAAGADILCLCDTAGGALPRLVREAALEVRKRFDGILGICARDQSGLAVANTLEAVEQGFDEVEGSLYSGLLDAGLRTVAADLEYKLGRECVGPENLEAMAEAARWIAGTGRILNLARPPRALRSQRRDEEAILETVEERLVGQLTSAGRSAVLDRIRQLEFEGYALASAGGTTELLVREELQPESRPFEAERYDLSCHGAAYADPVSTASVTVRVGDSVRSESESGAGPIQALERALRQCLFAVYPEISDLR